MPVVLNSLKTNAAVAAIIKVHKPRSFDGIVNSGVIAMATLKTMGILYDPANTKITFIMMTTKQAEIITKNNAEKDAVSSEKQLLIDRNAGFKLINIIATGSLNTLKSSDGVTPPQVVIASHLVTKVRGGRIKALKNPLPAEETPTVEDTTTVEAIVNVAAGDAELNTFRHNSVSFQKMGIKLGNLFTLLSYYKTLSCYQSNDDKLTIEGLFAFYDSLMLLNSTAEEAIAITNKAREARNESFFNNTTGARFLYTQVKKYIATTAGTKSANYKLVKGLPFPNLIVKKLRTATTNY